MSQVSDIDKTNASNQLKQTLQVKLLKKVADQIPSGYILFQDAVFLNIDDETYSFENGIMTIDIKATLHGFLFEENQLTKKFAKDMIDKYNGEDIYIPNIRNLNFTLSDKNISFSDAQNINFNISGNAKVVWRVDGESLATEVLGKSKKDLNDILAQHPNISSAEVKIKPFWKLSFPDKLKKIKIIVSYPDKSVN